MQQQIEGLAQNKGSNDRSLGDNEKNLVIIGQDCMEPLQAIRRAGPEVMCWFDFMFLHSSLAS